MDVGGRMRRKRCRPYLKANLQAALSESAKSANTYYVPLTAVAGTVSVLL